MLQKLFMHFFYASVIEMMVVNLVLVVMGVDGGYDGYGGDGGDFKGW